MRFVLRHGTREILFFSENRFVRFESPEAASDFLLQYLIDFDNMRRLRESLAASHAFSWLAHRDDKAVVEKVGEMLTDGLVKLLADPEGLTPWAWSFKSPTWPAELANSEFEANPLVMDDDETDPQDTELEDPIPTAVLPPTFIQVADMEARGITFLEQLYESALDLLRFVGLAEEGETEIGPAHKGIAGGQESALKTATEVLVADLAPLARGGTNPVPNSQVAQSLTVVAREHGLGVLQATEGTNAELQGILDNPGSPPAPSELAPAFRNAAEQHGTAVANETIQAQLTLKDLAKGGMPDVGATEVAPQLRQIGGIQGHNVVAATDVARVQIAGYGKVPDSLDVPGAETPGALRNIASSQIQGIVESTAVTQAGLAAMMDGVPPEPPRESGICQQFRATTAHQVEGLTQGTDFMGATMANAVAVVPMEHHDPSPISHAFLDSADVQTEGMRASAVRAGASLESLIGGPGAA